MKEETPFVLCVFSLLTAYLFCVFSLSEYLELLILKSSDSKAQIYLHIQDYNFDEGFKVR
jgi:hypothetical protein